MEKVPHYNILYFLRYKHPGYMNCLHIQKQQKMLKISLLLKKNTKFAGK